MAVYDNKEILIKLDELPQINGVRITNIYLEAYDKRGVKDYTVRDEDAEYHYYCKPYFHSDRNIIVRTLPNELQRIFDEPQHKIVRDVKTNELIETQIQVTSIFFRTRCSGNGSFIDQSISLDGKRLPYYGNRSSINVTRNNQNTNYVDVNDYGNKLLDSILNVRADIEEMKEHEYRYYPTTTLRKVDNLFYPDEVCSGWRRDHKMPYVKNISNGIRILNLSLKCHVYAMKLEPKHMEVDTEYILINFSREADSDKFCCIRSWNSRKEGNPNGMLKYRLDSKYITRDRFKTEMGRFTLVDDNTKVNIPLSDVYAISCIRNIDDEECLKSLK